MMSHLEGSVVDCLWDTFLVSWHKAMNPPPPCLGVTASSQAVPTFSEPGFASMFNEQGQFRKPEEDSANASIPEHLPGAPQYDDSVSGEIRRMHSALTPHHQGETEPEIIARHLSRSTLRSVSCVANISRLPYEEYSKAIRTFSSIQPSLLPTRPSTASRSVPYGPCQPQTFRFTQPHLSLCSSR
jgi:hypothetical protein